jgi:thymidine phosphorylase
LTLPQEIIARKRDGEALSDAEIDTVVRGLVDGTFGDAQAGAFAMAVVLNGMDEAETVALTHAMASSGRKLAWHDLPGPTVDKHSSGGIGDKVSLILAPLLAAVGAYVPMVSGRGLGHTGGTLDKLESFRGYDTRPSLDRFATVVRDVGCAIVGQTDDLAPADRRLYAIRDVTSTVESRSLIVASILAKKLAVGAAGLVMDVKVGNGAFMRTHDDAAALGRSIAGVANAAGLPTRALLTDMNQCLGTTAGNALEVAEAVAFLVGDARDERLAEVVLTLGVELLALSGLERDATSGRARLDAALADGSAAERFARMVAALGGPRDALAPRALAYDEAPIVVAVPATVSGFVSAVATRQLGLAVIELGGGRTQADQAVDHAVGLSAIAGIGRRVEAGDPLALVHGRDRDQGELVADALARAFTIAEQPPRAAPVIIDRL